MDAHVPMSGCSHMQTRRDTGGAGSGHVTAAPSECAVQRVVVDTNVPIVANGRSDPSEGSASPECRLAAVEFLEATLSSRIVLLDSDNEIKDEYHRYLNPRGEPGIGDRFYLQMLNSLPTRVERIDLPRDGDGQYEDFPDDTELWTFDRSDRKFAALARRTSSPVANATDSDWLNHREQLARNGIVVHFVCGCDRNTWYER
ncbi:hypothetical protein [Mycobacterium parmense]|uniref:Uncharacterized protein n=1 Tax=Mycobacterium parmense TaxID=185642 RepID=A0A7I7YQV9_9MYCO|nr:hypothetical protein [Mycobacterium parmense]MCV7349690.1 hypothetical protein [Mycobacterium parmense]BBZ43657.1 hypothetical protein MPRM_09380 [Mycobacterium parmense]